MLELRMPTIQIPILFANYVSDIKQTKKSFICYYSEFNFAVNEQFRPENLTNGGKNANSEPNEGSLPPPPSLANSFSQNDYG